MKMQLTIVTLITCFTVLASADLEPAPFVGSIIIPTNIEEKANAQEKMLDLIANIQAQGWDIQIKEEKMIAHRPYIKAKGEKIEDIILNKTKGCKELDSTCLRLVGNLNRRIEKVDLDYLNSLSGVLLLPHEENRFLISVKAGDNYKEGRIGTKRVGEAKRSFMSFFKDLSKYMEGPLTRFCVETCVDLYELKIID